MADKETNDQKKSTDSATSVEASAAASTTSSATSEASAQASTETSQSAAATAELQAKLDKQADQLLRAQAEIVNMQNRHQKEQANLIKYDGQKLATDVLPVLDNLERALETAADDEASKQLKKGVQMVYKHLEDALKKHHVTEIPALGEKFDPNVHQAVQSVPAEDGQKADTVVKVLQKGYLMKDRTLRPAMVVVAQ